MIIMVYIVRANKGIKIDDSLSKEKYFSIDWSGHDLMYVCSTLFMAWKIMGNHSYYHAEAIYHFSKKIYS